LPSDTGAAEGGRGRLAGRVALISGAARGQGAAEARLFVAEGAQVVVADVLEAEGRALAAQLGSSAAFFALDVREQTAWQAAVAFGEARFGPIDILVNNAAVTGAGGVRDVTLDSYLDTIAVNQLGCLLGMQSVVPSMERAGGGSIVNVSSTSGLIAYTGTIAYVASKWAVRGMTKAAALDLAPLGIRVNSIHPGPVDTPMIHPDGMGDDEFQSRWRQVVPLARAAQPVEIARVVLFLASSDSSYMTGAELAVDGGRTAGLTSPRI
jgi:3alpha(or 20beta)-hydroxysteroid dehydrogenase